MRGRQSWGPLWKARPGMTRTTSGCSGSSGTLTSSDPYSGVCATYSVFLVSSLDISSARHFIAIDKTCVFSDIP